MRFNSGSLILKLHNCTPVRPQLLSKFQWQNLSGHRVVSRWCAQICPVLLEHSLLILFIKPMSPWIIKKYICIILHSWNIYVDISLFTWFSSCRFFISVLEAFQEAMRYLFKLLFHADNNAKGFRLSISNVSRVDMVMLLWHGEEFKLACNL